MRDRLNGEIAVAAAAQTKGDVDVEVVHYFAFTPLLGLGATRLKRFPGSCSTTPPSSICASNTSASRDPTPAARAILSTCMDVRPRTRYTFASSRDSC